MEVTIAYSTLAMTVSLAVLRPRLPRLAWRFSPGTAGALGVAVLIATGLLTPATMLEAARVQWRPLLALTSIMVMTGVVQEAGAFDRLAAWIEQRARTRSAVHTFTVVFALAVVTPSLLNNDAAILILTPLVVALTRRLYPGAPHVTLAFAFVVFLAPGVAPFIVSNPMNMIVAEFAGLGFNAYAAVMVPLSLVGVALTYGLLRWIYRDVLRTAVPASAPRTRIHRHAGERPAVVLMVAVFVAYPIAAWFGAPTWLVAVVGALGAIAISQAYAIASLPKVTSHVSLDILVFLWGIFLVVRGLQTVGVVDWLANVYTSAPAGSHGELFVIGSTSALGSALIDNHPMSILNMFAIGPTLGGHGAKPLLAALVGGDIGPRLLPIGSLAGLLWMDLLRRAGVQVSVGRFVRVGTLVLLPTLALSLALLYWL
ncbi:MAG: ArsB/NhaD family transporter [Kofleriaceae bacterium]